MGPFYANFHLSSHISGLVKIFNLHQYKGLLNIHDPLCHEQNQ